jgi:hypothetical protein
LEFAYCVFSSGGIAHLVLVRAAGIWGDGTCRRRDLGSVRELMVSGWGSKKEVEWMWIFMNKKRQNKKRHEVDVCVFIYLACVCVCEKTKSKCCEK